MKPNVGRSRDCTSGITRTPCMPQTTAIALPQVAQLAAASRRPFSTTIAASMRCCSTAHPLPVEPDLGPVVGRRVEVVRRGAVDVGRPQLRVRRAVHVAAVWRQLFEQVVERRRACRRVTVIVRREASSLVRPTSKRSIS